MGQLKGLYQGLEMSFINDRLKRGTGEGIMRAKRFGNSAKSTVLQIRVEGMFLSRTKKNHFKKVLIFLAVRLHSLGNNACRNMGYTTTFGKRKGTRLSF